MSRVLFVDDEPLILSSLRTRLRRKRPEWDTEFASSGQEALDLMEMAPFDVIVSDMRMPGMDGAQLLSIVRERRPETFRIVLSAQMSRETQLRALPFTHRFLSKPCLPQDIEATIAGALELKDRFANPNLGRVVCAVRRLPSPPQTYQEITELMSDPRVGLARVARAVDKDPAVAARLLHVANSAFFGVRREIRTSIEALNWLGVDLVRKLVLSSELARKFADPPAPSAAILARVQRHALLTARIASRLVPERQAGTAASAALLHKVGVLVLAAACPQELERAEAVQREGRRAGDAERQVFGYSHAEVGAYLLNLWGLPLEIVEAVADHLSPRATDAGPTLGITGAVHLASELARSAIRRLPYYPDPASIEVDASFLDRAGLGPRMNELCLQAHHQALDMQEGAAGAPPG